MPHVDLLELPYFDGISSDDLIALVERMAPRRFAAGEVIMGEGDLGATPLYIATHGRIEVTKHAPNGKERRLAELQGPTLFGEIELFCQIPAVTTTRALTTVEAFCLTRPAFDDLFAQKHAALLRFTFNVARVTCHRLAVADEIMARLLEGEDLAHLRRTVFTTLRERSNWPSQTGAFKRP